MTLTPVNQRLHDVAKAGNLDSLIRALQDGADSKSSDAKGVTALHVACAEGHLACVSALVNNGANVHAVITSGYEAGELPAHCATTNDHADCLQVLLDAGTDVEAKGAGGMTLLMSAAWNGASACIAAVIAAGGQLEARDARGWTAFHHAASFGAEETLQALAQAGANIEAITPEGDTALHTAAAEDQGSVIPCLVSLGVDINRTNNAGCTAWHRAEDEEVRWSLLELGADPHLGEGLTAGDILDAYQNDVDSLLPRSTTSPELADRLLALLRQDLDDEALAHWACVRLGMPAPTQPDSADAEPRRPLEPPGVPTPSLLLQWGRDPASNPHSLVHGCVSYVNALFAAMYRPSELPRPAMVCYYTDYYLTQVNDGGVTQFVRNSRWSPYILDCIREGLADMQAARHVDLFERICRRVEDIGHALPKFLARERVAGSTHVCKQLDAFTNEFHSIQRSKPDLIECNAAYLARLPNAERLADDAYESRLAEITTLDEVRRRRHRDWQAQQEAERSPQERTLRAWADSAGKPFERFTMFSQGLWQERPAMYSYFLAGGSVYSAVDLGGSLVVTDSEQRILATLPLEASS